MSRFIVFEEGVNFWNVRSGTCEEAIERAASLAHSANDIAAHDIFVSNRSDYDFEVYAYGEASRRLAYFLELAGEQLATEQPADDVTEGARVFRDLANRARAFLQGIQLQS